MTHQRHIAATLFMAAVAQAGGVFWTDRGASQIKRMNFDGSGLQIVPLSGTVTSPGSNIRGLAIDTVSDRIFWADNGADRLLRANFDGTASTILHTVTGGNSFPADVRLDRGGSLFYWCDQLRQRIQRSTLDGAGVVTVISNAAATGPYFMDLDPAAGKIYWGDFDGGSIFRANLDGSGRETLLTGNNRTRGVCVDPGGDMLYWINRDDKKVHRCPLSSFTNGTIALTNPAVQTLYTNLDTPHGLVLDLPARKLYWADTGTNPGSGDGGQAVSRGDLDGGTPMEILAIGTEPWDVDLDRRCLSYTQWRMRCFRLDAPPEQTSPDADPDGDGLPNAVEYGLNLAPLNHELAGLPQGFLTNGPVVNAVYHGLRFHRRTGTSDLAYLIQTSTNLTHWIGSATEPATTEISIRSLEDDMEEIMVRSMAPLTDTSSHFLRLQILLGP